MVHILEGWSLSQAIYWSYPTRMLGSPPRPKILISWPENIFSWWPFLLHQSLWDLRLFTCNGYPWRRLWWPWYQVSGIRWLCSDAVVWVFVFLYCPLPCCRYFSIISQFYKLAHPISNTHISSSSPQSSDLQARAGYSSPSRFYPQESVSHVAYCAIAKHALVVLIHISLFLGYRC